MGGLIRTLCVGIVGAAVGASACASGVRTGKTAIAKGRDGSKLFEVYGFGPEGGGSLAYRFEGGSPSADSAEYILSSTFSPGGPTRPQTVSEAECRRRVD